MIAFLSLLLDECTLSLFLISIIFLSVGCYLFCNVLRYISAIWDSKEGVQLACTFQPYCPLSIIRITSHLSLVLTPCVQW
jgi:hypothetical protein